MAISNPITSADLSILESAFSILSTWFFHNWLAPNPENSDSLPLGTYQCNHTLSNLHTVNVSGSAVQLADYKKLLGITLYISLCFQKHVSFVSHSCFFHINWLYGTFDPALTHKLLLPLLMLSPILNLIMPTQFFTVHLTLSSLHSSEYRTHSFELSFSQMPALQLDLC